MTALVNVSGGRGQSPAGLRQTLNLPYRSFATRAAAAAQNLATETDVEIQRWSSGSLFEPARYTKVSAQPSHSMKFQDASGSWWGINERPIKVQMAGAMCDGTTDDSAACLIAVNASVNSEFEVPGTAMYFGTAVNGNFTQLMIRRNGSTFTGPGLGIFSVNVWWEVNQLIDHRVRGQPQGGAQGNVVGKYELFRNQGGAGYGKRFDYWQDGTLTSGFGLAEGRLGVFPSINGGSGMTDWTVAISPTSTSTTWSTLCAEWNIVNRGDDLGYFRKRASAIRWTGGIQMVPESGNFVDDGSDGRNALFAFLTARSGSFNSHDNDYTRFYNGFMVEEDSIAPDGVGYLASGAPSATREPRAAHVIDAFWEEGINLAGGTFSTGRAVTIDYGDRIQWGESGNIGTIQAVSGGGLLFGVGGHNGLRIGATSSAANNIYIYGTDTGQAPTITAVGATDTNIDIAISPLGTGLVRFGTFTSSSDAAVNGYVTIKDAAGNTRKLATIA